MVLYSDSPVVTAVISIVAVLLNIPISIAIFQYERTFVPKVILGRKEIDTGPGQTTTLEFDLLTGPNDVVQAGAYISIITALAFVIGLVVLRHFKTHFSMGWLVLGAAFSNLLGQIACCAAAFIFRASDERPTSSDHIKFENGMYDTDGRLFTKEAWSCAMKDFYAEREGGWAFKACSNFVC